MIKAEELRQGCKIKANGLHGGAILTVKCLDNSDSTKKRVVLFEEHEVGEFIQDCEGVALTPEILRASGFKYQDRDVNATIPMRFYISERFGKHREYWLEMNFPLKPLDRFFWWLCWDIGAGRSHIHLPEGESLRHLHNLQNTWQSLTGKEIEYTPVTEKA